MSLGIYSIHGVYLGAIFMVHPKVAIFMRYSVY